MFKEQMNKIKSLIIKNEDDGIKKERKIENLVVFLIILIITVITINTILKKDTKENNEPSDNTYKILAEDNLSRESYDSNELEKKLEKILGTMSGVRKSKCIGYIFKITRSSCYVQ